MTTTDIDARLAEVTERVASRNADREQASRTQLATMDIGNGTALEVFRLAREIFDRDATLPAHKSRMIYLGPLVGAPLTGAEPFAIAVKAQPMPERYLGRDRHRKPKGKAAKPTQQWWDR